MLYFFHTSEEEEESGKDWSDLEREAAEEDKKERNYDDFDRKRKGGRDVPRTFDSEEGRKKSKHDKSSSHKSSSSNHKSSSHKSPSKHSSSRYVQHKSVIPLLNMKNKQVFNSLELFCIHVTISPAIINCLVIVFFSSSSFSRVCFHACFAFV